MSKRHLIFFAIALAVFFSVYVGYRFYENRTKSLLAAKDANEWFASINRAFLQRVESANRLPRETAMRFPSLTPPVWPYTPEKWDSGGAVDSDKVGALATDVVGIHTTKLPDGRAYRLPLPKEKTILEGDITSDQEIIYIIFTTPENMPEFPPPNFDEFPIPYPLIAKAFDSPDDASLTQFRDWIESVGGAARAQSLLGAAGLSDSIRIETATIFHQ
ncbi:hypothetical protein F4X33_18535 [Candidatus Poribacteria bacterium]|nr:hypothetical protein [Candidatus Poribacteria bacterium]